MTDSSVLLPNTQSLPQDMLFNLKPSCMRSRQIRASIPTSNKSTFAPGDVAILYINAGRRNTYLDPSTSYLRYTIQNNDVNSAISFDNCGA